MFEGHDYAVIGAGVIGTLCVEKLSENSLNRVLWIDKGREGISSKSLGIIRAYHDDLETMEAAATSYSYWQGQEKFRPTGLVYVLTPSQLEHFPGRALLLDRLKIPHELLGLEEARERFPTMRFSHVESGAKVLFEQDSGTVEAQGFLCQKKRELKERRNVHYLEVELTGACKKNDHYQLTLDGLSAVVKAKKIILCAGLGTPGVLKKLGLDLGFYPKEISLKRISKKNQEARLPIIFDFASRTFLAETQGEYWVGQREAGPKAMDPFVRKDSLVGQADQSHDWKFSDLYTKGMIGSLGEAPGMPGFWVAAGFGGTGFKLAPAIARRIACCVQTN